MNTTTTKVKPQAGGFTFGIPDTGVANEFILIVQTLNIIINVFGSSQENRRKNAPRGRWSHALYAHVSRISCRLCARTLGDPGGNKWLVVVLALMVVNARLNAGTGVLTAFVLHTDWPIYTM